MSVSPCINRWWGRLHQKTLWAVDDLSHKVNRKWRHCLWIYGEKWRRLSDDIVLSEDINTPGLSVKCWTVNDIWIVDSILHICWTFFFFLKNYCPTYRHTWVFLIVHVVIYNETCHSRIRRGWAYNSVLSNDIQWIRHSLLLPTPSSRRP